MLDWKPIGNPVQTGPWSDGSFCEITPVSDGYAVGFRYRNDKGEDRYVYMNPSGAGEDPDVFVYRGGGDPAWDEPDGYGYFDLDGIARKIPSVGDWIVYRGGESDHDVGEIRLDIDEHGDTDGIVYVVFDSGDSSRLTDVQERIVGVYGSHEAASEEADRHK